MKFVSDHDLHIHSGISLCSNDAAQTPERLLRYAKDNGLRQICITDHFWDDKVCEAIPWYAEQNFEHISVAKPLPQSDKVQFLFGCETEIRHDLVLGVAKERFDEFDFIIIPTTHLSFEDFTITERDNVSFKARAEAWVRRLDFVLSSDLPFHKIGIPHLTCGLISPLREQRYEVVKEIPENEMYRLFKQAAKVGVGIELNSHDFMFADSDASVALVPYQIAKECGCKFYCGSDSHEVEHFEYAKDMLERAVDFLDLTEDDKFHI